MAEGQFLLTNVDKMKNAYCVSECLFEEVVEPSLKSIRSYQYSEVRTLRTQGTLGYSGCQDCVKDTEMAFESRVSKNS